MLLTKRNASLRYNDSLTDRVRGSRPFLLHEVIKTVDGVITTDYCK